MKEQSLEQEALSLGNDIFAFNRILKVLKILILCLLPTIIIVYKNANTLENSLLFVAFIFLCVIWVHYKRKCNLSTLYFNTHSFLIEMKEVPYRFEKYIKDNNIKTKNPNS